MSLIKTLEADALKVWHLIEPVAKHAAAAGVADLEGDAIAAVTQIAANPGELTDDQQREAAVKALAAKLEAQGAAVSKDAVIAAVSAVRVAQASQAASPAPQEPAPPAAA